MPMEWEDMNREGGSERKKPRHKKWVIERCQGRGRKGPELSKGEERDWTAVPIDALSAIFEKVGPINVLLTAQFVCRSWHQAAHDPLSWRCANFTIAYCEVFVGHGNLTGFGNLVEAAVDRSKGSMEEFSAYYAVKDENLLYIAQRSSKLKRLRLSRCYQISGEAINQAFKLCPLIEDLDIAIGFLGEDFLLDLPNQLWPPLLKRFRSNFSECEAESESESESESELEDEDLACNLEALCIARNMTGLRELQIIGNSLSNKGLRAILNGCSLLEALDLRQCLNVDLSDEDINTRCRSIKKFKGPEDSMADMYGDLLHSSEETDDD